MLVPTSFNLSKLVVCFIIIIIILSLVCLLVLFLLLIVIRCIMIIIIWFGMHLDICCSFELVGAYVAAV